MYKIHRRGAGGGGQKSFSRNIPIIALIIKMIIITILMTIIIIIIL